MAFKLSIAETIARVTVPNTNSIADSGHSLPSCCSYQAHKKHRPPFGDLCFEFLCNLIIVFCKDMKKSVTWSHWVVVPTFNPCSENIRRSWLIEWDTETIVNNKFLNLRIEFSSNLCVCLCCSIFSKLSRLFPPSSFLGVLTNF